MYFPITYKRKVFSKTNGVINYFDGAIRFIVYT